MPRPINSLANIISHAVRDGDSGCLLYTGYVDKDGYPKVSYRGSMHLGSQVVFALSYGAIPAGHEVDHVCHVRRCVEPTHLRAVTHQENVIQIKSYVEKRHRRLKRLLETYPPLASFPVLLTSPELQALWQCTGTGHVKKLLRTMSHAFPQDFHYERFKARHGRQPALYAIGLQPNLIALLSPEDDRREAPAVDMVALVA